FCYRDTPPTDIFTLSLHDALPISQRHQHLEDLPVVRVQELRRGEDRQRAGRVFELEVAIGNRVLVDDRGGVMLIDAVVDDLNARDRKSTRLNSSHVSISYAVFCLK